MLAAPVHQPDGVEDLHRPMGVQGRDHPRDRAEVAVEERAQAPIVVDRPGPGAAAHEQLEARDAEGVLHVDRDQADPQPILGGRPDAVRPCPRGRLGRPLLVRHAPDLAHPRGREMRRDGQFVHARIDPMDEVPAQAREVRTGAHPGGWRRHHRVPGRV